MKVLIAVNVMLVSFLFFFHYWTSTEINKLSTRMSEAKILKLESQLSKLIQLTQSKGIELDEMLSDATLAASKLNSIEIKLKASSNYITASSGKLELDKNNHPALISDGKCNEKRGIFEQKVNFSSSFIQPPDVVIALSSFDVRAGKDSRFKSEVVNVDKDGFTFNAYTWCDTSVSYAELTWLAVGV